MKQRIVFATSTHTCDVNVCYIIGQNYIVHVIIITPDIRTSLLTNCRSL